MASLLVVCLSHAKGGMENVVLSDCEVLKSHFQTSLLCYDKSYLAQQSPVPIISSKGLKN